MDGLHGPNTNVHHIEVYISVVSDLSYITKSMYDDDKPLELCTASTKPKIDRYIYKLSLGQLYICTQYIRYPSINYLLLENNPP